MTTHLFLAFFLLFGQFSSVLHAMEHLQSDSSKQSLDIHEHGHNDRHDHPLNFQHPQGAQIDVEDSHSAESVTCLVYHLLGHMPALLPAQVWNDEHFSPICRVAADQVEPMATGIQTGYSIRGPPDSV